MREAVMMLVDGRILADTDMGGPVGADRPPGQLVSQVTTVADGAYDQPISTTGPTEVTALAQAVASMRDSIVHNSEALLRARQELTRTRPVQPAIFSHARRRPTGRRPGRSG